MAQVEAELDQLESYLAEIRAEDLVLVTAHRDDEFVRADTLAVARATIESLEQLRLLENGLAIHVVVTDHSSTGVDSPADLVKVARMMRNQQQNS